LKKFLLVYSFPILIGPVLIALLAEWPSTASMRGVTAITASWIGTGTAIAFIGSIGILYRPNRLVGLISGIIIASVLWFSGMSESTAENTCLTTPSGVSVCAPVGEWTARPSLNNSTHQFESKGEWFGQLVVDDAGRDKGMTAIAAAELIKSNLTANGATILIDGESSDGENRILVYTVDAKGIPMIFANTIKIGKTHTLQIVTFRIAQKLEASDREAHQRFGRAVSIPPDF